MSGHGCEELSTDQIILERNILLFMSSTVLFKPTKHLHPDKIFVSKDCPFIVSLSFWLTTS